MHTEAPRSLLFHGLRSLSNWDVRSRVHEYRVGIGRQACNFGGCGLYPGNQPRPLKPELIVTWLPAALTSDDCILENISWIVSYINFVLCMKMTKIIPITMDHLGTTGIYLLSYLMISKMSFKIKWVGLNSVGSGIIIIINYSPCQSLAWPVIGADAGGSVSSAAIFHLLTIYHVYPRSVHTKN